MSISDTRTSPSCARRAFLAQAAGAVGAIACGPAFGALTGTDLNSAPISGVNQPELASVDDMMRSIMRDKVPGASFAVTKDRRLVYARGFGLADISTQQAVQPASLFRIASVSKPFTAVAILQFVEQKRLALSDRVWDVLNLAEPADNRWKSITILNLLQHTGGWDRDQIRFDPMFAHVTISRALNVASPVEPRHIIQYMLTRPLEFDPGGRSTYSNFGYCLLGRVIERLAGASYEEHLQRAVLAPLGIRRMRLGKTLPAQRAAGEVTYYDERTAPSVFGKSVERVPLPYGAWSLEAMDSNGGWLASAVDLVRFAAAFDQPATCPVLKAETIEKMFAPPEVKAAPEPDGLYWGCGWLVRSEGKHKLAHSSHNGITAGTSAYLMRRRDGIDWAVIFNTARGKEGEELILKVRDSVDAALAAVTHWPDTDQFARLL